MEIYTIITGILGLLGIGAIANTILQTTLQTNIDRKKILFDKKFTAYADFSATVLGLNFKEQRGFFELLASSARVRLLATDEDLVEKIDDFIINLDSMHISRKRYIEEKEESRAEEKKEKFSSEFTEVLDQAEKIILDLKKDLTKTLGTESKTKRFLMRLIP